VLRLNRQSAAAYDVSALPSSRRRDAHRARLRIRERLS
jgi:hypothetical protein